MFAFISPKFAPILKYYVQLCDCMIAAFRNSAWEHTYIDTDLHRDIFPIAIAIAIFDIIQA